MPSPSRRRLLTKLADWSSESSESRRGALDAEIVHKTQCQNVAIARLDRYDPEDSDRFLAELLVDTSHPYFFEHAIDHVPGLMLIEAIRQAATAAMHLFYGVPLDAASIIDRIEITFERYAELDALLFAALRFDEKGYRGERLTSAQMSVEFIQDNLTLGHAVMAGRQIWWAR